MGVLSGRGSCGRISGEAMFLCKVFFGISKLTLFFFVRTCVFGVI
jgi:hypothetical protein